MSDIAIRVEDLSKAYHIGLKGEMPDTVAAAVGSWLRKPLKNFQQLRRLNTFRANGDADDIIWALKDVSFDVKQGEVLGIIGRNGAGKSTLLKILSRITEPTRGQATIHGRVSSLLEVGTGFHPELTGRENVYLNGTILGMTKREIDRKFDEIVDFSGVEKFLDTPVKRYSSGMRVRLAFSVAAHLDPEILMIDEVLAVGDYEFQKKCLGKMNNVAKDGRTVLFVSHNMDAVVRLCSIACRLEKGLLADHGCVDTVVRSYLEGPVLSATAELALKPLGEGVRLEQIRVSQDGCECHGSLDNSKEFQIAIQYSLSSKVNDLLLGFDVLTPDGTLLFRTYDLEAYGMCGREPGTYTSTCRFPATCFQPGTYFFNVLAGIHRLGWLSKDEITLQVRFTDGKPSDVNYQGVLLPVSHWTVKCQ